jgi:catechol 2,3-dioxygenase-like lactoylglutathione lyase family enzyme
MWRLPGGCESMGPWGLPQRVEVDGETGGNLSIGAWQSKGRAGSVLPVSVRIRYIVDDVEAAIPFYTDLLGFRVKLHPAPGFAMLSRGELELLLNEPGAGGAGQPMPGGREPEPGGWNRIQLEVADLAGEVATLRRAGARFRGDIVEGKGGRQILVEDPAGNPIELFEPGQRQRPA